MRLSRIIFTMLLVSSQILTNGTSAEENAEASKPETVSTTENNTVMDFNEIGYWSLLEIKVLNGSAKDVAKKHIEMNAVKECLEAIPGCLYGGDLVSTDNDQDMLVLCGWQSKADSDAWQQSPIRKKQIKESAGLSEFKVEMTEREFESYFQVVQN